MILRDDKSRLLLYAKMQEVWKKYSYHDAHKWVDVDDYIDDNYLTCGRILGRALFDIQNVDTQLDYLKHLKIIIEF